VTGRAAALRPLDGIRVLELGQVIAGTYGTQALADYGAEVIKVEPPWGELGRNPATGDLGGMSSLFASVNRNKRSVALDLRIPAAREVVLDLVRWADVVIENFRPGTLERLGLGEPSLRAVNPGLIFGSVTGFGPDGEAAGLPSYDLVHQALGGWMGMLGEADGPPVALPIPVADLLAGFYLTHGVLAALVHRERTGEGTSVDTSMLDVMLSLLTYQATMYYATGLVPPRRGSEHEYHVPWGAYATADGHLIVAPREERFWRALCDVLGVPGLVADPRFADAAARRRHRDELVPLLAERFATRTTAAWLDALRAGGVPAAPIHDLGAALESPYVAQRELTLEVEPTGVGRPVRVLANPVRFGGTRPDRREPPPAIGEHTDEVLAGVLGYDEARIAGLRRAGAAPDPSTTAATPGLRA
jgi:crotonobetainyl-CoA:carnitine CoA-transferase CaiB-like acyl-CoA transferase